jgi:type I restriction enzyme M protein
LLNAETKRHIDAARNVLVGVAPNPMTQVDQITYALIYKFMDDMDESAIKLGGEPSFFVGDLEPYAYSKLMDSRLGNQERMNLYGEALTKFAEAKQLPELFRTIFRAAFLPYRSPETLGLFLKEINFFDYSHPEELGNAYEYLLSIMSAQGDAGQFRTPRHIIDFMVDVIDPSKSDTVLDPACGTGGFLVSSYNHILEKHDGKNNPIGEEVPLTPDERRKLMGNFEGYDIDPSMVRIAQVNMYLHLFKNPKIFQYDSLTNDERWNDKFDVILANPPFMSPKGGIKPHQKFGIHSNRSEVLFVDYIASHLKPNGRAGIIVPEGIIFQSGIAYKQLRRELLEQGLYAVVSLPIGVFQPYSGVKTSILFIDRDIARTRDEILFIKISNDGFDSGAAKRVTGKNDLPAAVTEIAQWARTGEVASHLGTAVSKAIISSTEDCNLSADKYTAPTSFEHSEWPLVPLSQILEVQNGFAFDAGEFNDDFDGIPVIRIRDINSGFSRTYYKGSYDPKYVVNDGDLLVGMDGDFKAKIWRDGVALLNQRVCRLMNFRDVEPEYVLYVIQRKLEEIQAATYAVTVKHLSAKQILEIQIPLPPLEIQKNLVQELNSYASIIDGAHKVIDNLGPRFEMNPEWPISELGSLISLEYGKPLKQEDRLPGQYKVFGSNGAVGLHSEYLVKGPFIIVGRKGSAGAVVWSDEDGWPIDTTFFVSQKDAAPTNLRFIYMLLKRLNLDKVNVQSGVPGLNRNDALRLRVHVPPKSEQDSIATDFEHQLQLIQELNSLIASSSKNMDRVIEKLWN